MVARYGSTESRAILNFLLQKNKISEVSAIIKHITGKMNIYWKNHPKFLNNLVELSGFFPKEEKQLEEFEKEQEEKKNGREQEEAKVVEVPKKEEPQQAEPLQTEQKEEKKEKKKENVVV